MKVIPGPETSVQSMVRFDIETTGGNDLIDQTNHNQTVNVSFVK